MASCELTLEELLPEVANVFAIQESALFNCMSILSTTITRHEEESKSKASAADIAQVRGDVKKATEFFGDSKKMIQRLEKTQERLLAELSDLRQENASKDTALAALERQQEQHMAAYEQHLEELDRRFECISRMKSEQKDVVKRIEIQERSYAELKFGMAMLAKSIGDDTGEAAPILPLVSLVPVSGRNSNSDHRSMKHIMSTAHLRRPTLAAVAAITAVSQGSASNVAPLDPMMAPMSRKASISKLNDHLSDRNSSDKSVLVDVTTAVLVRQGSTLFKKAPSMALLPPSPNASAPPPDLTDTSIQMSRRMSERSDSYRVESADALSEVALLDEVTQTLVASAVQSPPGLVTDASANFVDGMADQDETTLEQEHEADVGALLEPRMVPGGVAGGLAPNDPARRVGETEAGGASSANAPQEPAHLEPVGSAATPATTVDRIQPISPQVDILDAPPTNETSQRQESTPIQSADTTTSRNISTKSLNEKAVSESRAISNDKTSQVVETNKAVTSLTQTSSKQVAPMSAEPDAQSSASRRVSSSSIAPPMAEVVQELPESPRESGMMRSHAEYKYLWHWAYSNVIALYRMHGQQNVQQLLSGTKKDTVGSRVRQIEDTMDAVHDSLDDMRAKVDGLDAVHSDLEHIKVSTTEVVEQVASLRIVSSQTEANTQHLQDQLRQLEGQVQEFVQSFTTSRELPAPKPHTPRPVAPVVPVAAFEALQAYVATLDKSLARLDPFMATCAAVEATTKTELQAITANLTTQAQVWEKELGKLADDGRKNAADHKRQADDAAAHVNAVVGRLYEWVHFLGDALHVACCADNPADSAPYRHLVSAFRSKYSSLGAKLVVAKAQPLNPATDAAISAVCHHVDGLADVKDRDVDKYMVSGMAPLALLLDTLSQATSDDPAANSHRTALVRLVRETLVEAKGVACVALLFARFGAVHTKAAALATALDDTKAAMGRQTKDIYELNSLHSVIKTMSAKVEYVVNNTQTMIVEDDLNKVVARLSDEREQLRADVYTSVKQLFAVSSELEASLEREVTALASRLHTKIDRDEVGMAQQTMQGELERLAHDVVSHDEFVVLSERLKRKPDSNDIRAYVRQKISTLKLQQTEANTDAPLLGSVPVRCISCQNVVEAKAQPVVPRDDKPQRDVLPFTTSSVRHVQKQKLEAMLRAKGALK
ncbi:hypothetical protein H257_01279 [Aphanomyces astaci]|uniref:Uncharacterized protein n=1 Tax=Aphanomyces astaci TaxID=112090 RepID=W4H8E8_APHAT|nr:hypothetical protein H257_01279 [Aphanomyces astaci]ETV87841.1 hypothetical protein H257_01279 [Aphanomyces astaci]|eukprot:XP_009822704.1 hypothetical protein H257_01279 [Aphanomyces astaci]